MRAEKIPSPAFVSFALALCLSVIFGVRLQSQESSEKSASPAPRPDERQLPKAMRSASKELPRIKVGKVAGDTSLDIVGSDGRALQAAVDYVAGLGGGVVEIGEGEFLMHDSLHLRSRVTVRGQGDKTVLKKAPSVTSQLSLDGDFGEEQVTVESADGFDVGCGIAIWDSEAGGFHTTVARITGRTGNTLAISRPLNADCMVSRKARATTVFPVISGYDLEDARVESITVDGARDKNGDLNGCRGAGIFLYRGFGTVIEGCTVRSFNGDGISFQQSNDVQVLRSRSEGNAGLGIHPGSGSQRAIVRACVARGNGGDGLYLCWRVRHGLFEENELSGNEGHGISIGHKDSDNLLRRNTVRENGRNGVYFRDESEGMAGHRNRIEENLVENNGRRQKDSAGIWIDGETSGVVLKGNTIRDTREAKERTQRTAISIGSKTRDVILESNKAEGETVTEDHRPRAEAK